MGIRKLTTSWLYLTSLINEKGVSIMNDCVVEILFFFAYVRETKVSYCRGILQGMSLLRLFEGYFELWFLFWVDALNVRFDFVGWVLRCCGCDESLPLLIEIVSRTVGGHFNYFGCCGSDVDQNFVIWSPLWSQLSHYKALRSRLMITAEPIGDLLQGLAWSCYYAFSAFVHGSGHNSCTLSCDFLLLLT